MTALALAALLQVEFLGDDDLDVRERATAELRKAGLEAGPALMRAIESPDAEVRARAVMLLDELAAKLPATAMRVWLDFEDGRAFLCVRNTSRVRVVVRGMKIVDARSSVCVIAHGFRVSPASPAEQAVSPIIAVGPEETRRLVLPRLVPVDDERSGIEVRPVCAWGSGETKGAVARLRVAARPGDGELVYALKNADAVAMASTLVQIFEGDLRNPSPMFRPDARTNSVVVSGANEETLVLVEYVIEQLDRNPSEPSPGP